MSADMDNALSDLVFGPMPITDLFKVHNGAGSPRKDKGAVPYVAASFQNNGVVGYVDTAKYPGGWLSLVKDGDGGAGKCFYQPVPFWPSNHVFALEPKISGLTAGALLCIAALITHQCFPKYSRGHAINAARLSRQKIMVPVSPDSDGKLEVDWSGLTRLGEELLAKAKARASVVRETRPTETDTLPDLVFEPLLITKVFESMKASTAWYDRVSLKSGAGRNLYLSQTLSSNSVAEIVADQDFTPEPGNGITMTLKTQATFYQPQPFYTAQNFLIFRHPSLNPDNGMILVTAMRRAAEKFSWGYGVSMARLSKTRIMVPVTTDAQGKRVVDWDGMSCYGRALRIRAERAIKAVLGSAVSEGR